MDRFGVFRCQGSFRCVESGFSGAATLQYFEQSPMCHDLDLAPA
jgi:hypothetical protein